MGEDVRARYSRILMRGEGTDRIQFFSDAVIAIAMTLLVLEIRLPADAEGDLGQALADLWPSYLAYGLSFAIIGLNWVSHHRKFRYIVRFDPGLIRINLVFLLVIAFLPFPTSVMAEHGRETPAIVLYAATVATLSLLQLWLWSHAHRHGLMDAAIDDGVYRYVAINLLPVPVVFLVSIPLAFLVPRWTTFFWILILPVGAVVGRLARNALDATTTTPGPQPRRSRGSAS
jgi:uncharacterized membrane protein